MCGRIDFGSGHDLSRNLVLQKHERANILQILRVAPAHFRNDEIKHARPNNGEVTQVRDGVLLPLRSQCDLPLRKNVSDVEPVRFEFFIRSFNGAPKPLVGIDLQLAFGRNDNVHVIGDARGEMARLAWVQQERSGAENDDFCFLCEVVIERCGDSFSVVHRL